MTVLMSAYLIRSRVVPRNNGFRLYNYYYMVVGMRAFFNIKNASPTTENQEYDKHSCCELSIMQLQNDSMMKQLIRLL